MFSGYCHTSKERDTESGNDYFGARYYASSMGRFMSPDWASNPVPVPFAKMENPPGYNPFDLFFLTMKGDEIQGTVTTSQHDSKDGVPILPPDKNNQNQ